MPWRLRDADYEPFIQSIRATIAGAGGLRIDHVMGLFRLWWVPADGSAADGAYVRYPAEDLLDIVALESHRAQALVVGEDLGTVEDGVREAMAEHGILSYRLLWFEDDDPAEWPAAAMAAITTHDLPTVAGLWTGADVEEQREHGTGTDEELERGRTSLLGHLPKLADDAPVEKAVERGAPPARRGAVPPAVGDPGRRRRRAAAAEHARAPPTGPTGRCRCRCRSRTCRGTRCCDGGPARSRGGLGQHARRCRRTHVRRSCADCCHGGRHDSRTRGALPRRARGRLGRRVPEVAGRLSYAAAGDGGEGRHCWVRDPPEAAGVWPGLLVEWRAARRLVAGPGGLHGDRAARPGTGRVVAAGRPARAALNPRGQVRGPAASAGLGPWTA